MSEAIALGRVPEVSRHEVSLQQAAQVWLRVALLSFGGPAGQIAVMHRILVEEKRWISEKRFLHALNYCMLLPGPEAQQLATYIGWLMHRTWAASLPAGCSSLPGIVAIMALSWSTPATAMSPVVAALFFGLKAAVLPIVLEAVLRIGKRALKNRRHGRRLRRAAFIAIFFFAVPFPVIVLGAGLIGYPWRAAGLAAFRERRRPRPRREKRAGRSSIACSARNCPSTRARPSPAALRVVRASGSPSGSCR